MGFIFFIAFPNLAHPSLPVAVIHFTSYLLSIIFQEILFKYKFSYQIFWYNRYYKTENARKKQEQALS